MFTRPRIRSRIPGRGELVSGVDEPNATNTGYLALPTVTYSGSSTITTNDTTIENMIIPFWMDIRAARFTARNCWARGDATTLSSGRSMFQFDHANAVDGLIEDCTLDPQLPSRFANGIQGRNFTARRNRIRNVTDYFLVRNVPSNGGLLNVDIQQNYGECFAWHIDAGQGDLQTHNDGIQLQGGDGTGSLAKGNALHAVYSTTVGDTPRPDRGTGTITDGRYNWGSLVGIQYTDLSGFTTNMTVYRNWIYGGKVAVSAGTANSTDIGTIYENWFDDTQGQRASNSVGQGHTISMDATTTCLTGDGTSQANRYMTGIPTIGGNEVTVRRNA